VELEIELARMDAAHHDGSMTVEPALYQEVNDLAARGLVGLWLGDGAITSASRVFGGGSESESIGQTALTAAGEFLHRLLRLSEMPMDEQCAWLEQFRGRPRRRACSPPAPPAIVDSADFVRSALGRETGSRPAGDE
jgi:hypothetical protein